MFSSPNEKKIYECYVDEIEKNGYAPSLERVRDLTNISIVTIRRYRQILCEKNYLNHIPGKKMGTSIGANKWK
tara:strand:- start:221 stop:439 length:219 start_codon:yes stop_codon:yes gene_type:complete